MMRPLLRALLDAGRKNLSGPFTFEREAKWLVVIYLLLPLLGILAAIVIPAVLRRWF